MVDMSVNLGGLAMRTPVATASGTFGYGAEYLGALDYRKLGAVTAKGVRMREWPGNPMPRHVEVKGGMINAIGLQGPGADLFADAILPQYFESVEKVVGEGNAPPVIANVWGGSADEYARTAERLSRPGGRVAAIEMNVSCPNVEAGGHTFGQDPAVLKGVVAAVRSATALPLFVKLAPNVPDMRPYAEACVEAGADALSLINTIPAMAIDIETRRPALGNVRGGLSGRCVHPVAVKAVYDCHSFCKLPILAMGGVYTAEDAIELMLAGAAAVAVGTATFTDPSAAEKVCDGLEAYCARKGFLAVRELTGNLA